MNCYCKIKIKVAHKLRLGKSWKGNTTTDYDNRRIDYAVQQRQSSQMNIRESSQNKPTQQLT